MGLAFTMRYAAKIQRQPKLSYSYHSDKYFRDNQDNADINARFNVGDILVLATIVATIAWVIWGSLPMLGSFLKLPASFLPWV